MIISHSRKRKVYYINVHTYFSHTSIMRIDTARLHDPLCLDLVHVYANIGVGANFCGLDG